MLKAEQLYQTIRLHHFPLKEYMLLHEVELTCILFLDSLCNIIEIQMHGCLASDHG